MSFVNALKSQLSEATQLTENGAVGYVTTGKAIVDMFFKVSSYRGMSDADVLADYTKVYAEDPNLAVKFAFYVGDIREGLGERRLFKLMIKFLADKENFDKLIKFVPEYNRFDSLFVLRGTELESKMVKYVHAQLKADAKADHPSLLAKWMPSVNTSSEKTKELARWFISKFNMTEREYRKLLSKIRKQLDVVEVKMCGNEWDKISYTGVPSKANINYKDAFLKHDEERRRAFLDKAVKGEVKMNSSTNFPHDIVHSYFEGGWCSRLKAKDDALEALWANLKDTVKEAGANFIVVRDGSGSMTSTISGTTVTALDVASALSIYFAERQSGEFKNKFITLERSVELPGTHPREAYPKRPTPENPVHSTDTEDRPEEDENAVDGAEGVAVKKTQVKVSSVEDAKDYLVDKFGIASSKLRTRAACIAAGEENGIEFIWE
jgi:hypothetical protein